MQAKWLPSPSFQFSRAALEFTCTPLIISTGLRMTACATERTSVCDVSYQQPDAWSKCASLLLQRSELSILICNIMKERRHWYRRDVSSHVYVKRTPEVESTPARPPVWLWPSINEKSNLWVISGFCCEADENRALLGCYVASSGNFVARWRFGKTYRSHIEG